MDVVAEEIANAPTIRAPWLRALGRQWDAAIFGVLLVAVNLPLLWGGDTGQWAFSADRIAAGEWWRLFMHPFAHLSWYHLLLDAGVFLPLYVDLGHRRKLLRFTCVLTSGAGALLGAMIFSNDISTIGMRGLSGIAYGLMAVWAVEMLRNRQQDRAIKTIGVAVLGFVFFTIAWEHATGAHFLDFLLFDMVGTPIVGCHLGGIVGALAAWGAVGKNGSGARESLDAMGKRNRVIRRARHGMSNLSL